MFATELPQSRREWIGGILTVIAAFCVPIFVKGEIAVVYICGVIFIGAILTFLWVLKAKKKTRK